MPAEPEVVLDSPAPLVMPVPANDLRTGAEFVRLLKKCSLFRDLPESDLAVLAAHAHRRRVLQGEPIFHAGSPGDSMIGVLLGTVRISLPSRSGKDLILADIQAGEIFGEIAVLDGGVRSADAGALTNCDLVVLERRDILPFLLQRPTLCLTLIGLICGKLRLADTRTSDIAFLEMSARLAKVLRDRAAAAPGARIGLTQTEIGRMIGASREKVNGQIKEWEREGILGRSNGWTIVLDASALGAIAEAD